MLDDTTTTTTYQHARVLCIGDLHIGCRPTRITDDHLARAGLTAADITPAAAWQRLVDHAIAERVDAVVLLGDVVDESNQVFAALTPLREGAERLAAAGIPLRAIAGNHDADVLPRLAAQIPHLELLGAGGTWQDTVVTGPTGNSVRLVGWSFPHSRHLDSPLASMPDQIRAASWSTHTAEPLPVLGLLHCDLDASRSAHAPVMRSALTAVTAVDAWLLGHIHAPARLDAADHHALAPDRPLGYLGSVAPLDPGEPGRHGAWIASCTPGRVTIEHVPAALHRYERVEVVLAPGDDVDLTLVRAIEAHHDSIRGELRSEQLVLARVTLSGHVAPGTTIDPDLLTHAVADFAMTRDGVHWVLERAPIDATSPAIDIAAIAASRAIDAPLARLLLEPSSGRTAATIVAPRRERMRRGLASATLRQATLRKHDSAIGPIDELLADDSRLDDLLERAARRALAAIQEERR